MFKPKSFPQGAINIAKTLKKANYQAFLVGGCVRDLLLKLPVTEWDITTSAKPEEVEKLFNKTIPTGKDFGTITVMLPDGQYEVTTYRSDENYLDGRHPSCVKFTNDIHQDLSRRDFTINALAYDPETKEFIDDYEGQKDLSNKLIKAIGSPIDRFSEDGLRSVRACRFAAKLNFSIEDKTFAAISKTLNVTKKVAAERIHDEIVKLLKTEQPSVGFELMRQAGLLRLFLPELEECYGIEQPPKFHKYDVFWHILHSCNAAPKDNLILRLATLLHDVGKPSCKKGLTFYNHDKVSAKMATEILKRLKFSNTDIKKVSLLISEHMFNYSSEWSDAAVRRFLRRIGGVTNVADLFALRLADCKGMERETESDYLKELQSRIDKIVLEQNALHVADLKINGQDVMTALNIKAGPKVGQVLDTLLEKVLDEPKLNEHEKLMSLIKIYSDNDE